MVTSAPLAPIRRFLPVALVLGGLFGCAAGAAPHGDAGIGDPDGSVLAVPDGGADAGPQPECAGDSDCPQGFVCAAVNGVPTCVPNPNPPPPGDGTDCSPCPSPGECRMNVCIQPTGSGAFCEFDSECGDGELCIAGRCTPNPRVPVSCSDSSSCPTGLTCGPAGTCICMHTTDCPIGLVCLDSGLCGPGDGTDGAPCVADAECDMGMVCDAGRCRPSTVCDIANPDFTGTWDMQSVLHIRDALPDWLDSFLSTVAGPFSFLAGDATCIDFGLPSAIEMEICDLVRPFVDEYLPPWSFPVFRAIAALNDVLNDWHIDETMELMPGSATDSYRGTHTWTSITMYYRSMPLMGTPESILDWRFAPSPFNASAVCGTFNIERHDVNVSIGSIIAWAVDTLVYELSDHRWATASDALTEMAGGFCDALGAAADSSVDYSGVGATVSSVCRSALSSLIDDAIHRLIEARIGASPITLRGEAPISGPDSLRPGTWDGTLLGSDFPGEFGADRH